MLKIAVYEKGIIMLRYVMIFLVAISTYNASEASEIDAKMQRFESLFKELYTFNKSHNFARYGYSAAGKGRWNDSIQALNRDVEFRNFLKHLSIKNPNKKDCGFTKTVSFGTGFIIMPSHLWSLGRYYMNNSGRENEPSLCIKNRFIELFKKYKKGKSN